MSLDSDLKGAFERHVLDQDPTPEAWDGLEAKVKRVHATRLVLATTLSVAVLVGAASFATTLRGGTVPDPGFATNPPSASPSALPAAMPEQFVIVRDSGAIEVRSTRDGSVVRVLVAADDAVRRSDVSRSGSSVYFVEQAAPGGDACSTRVRRVPFDGGAVETLATGSDVALSPDGESMAYAAIGSAPKCLPAGIVIRSLIDDGERTWATKAYPRAYADATQVQALVWQDPTHVLFAITTGDPSFEYFLLDVTQGETILDAREMNVEAQAAAESALYDPSFSSGDPTRFLLVEESPHDLVKPRYLWWMDVATGRKLDRVLRVDALVSDVEVAPSGRQILYTVEVLQADGPTLSRTYVWDGDGAPRLVADVGGVIAW